MKKLLLLNSLIAITLLLCSGCASVVDGCASIGRGWRPKITINSNPQGAKVTVIDDDGFTVATTNTPAKVRLARDKGFFQGQHYTVKFDMPGYNPSEAYIRSTVNPWYAGNILVGGVPGFVLVDPLTGAMWMLRPKTINQNLVPVSQSQGLAPVPKPAAAASPNTPPKS